MFFMVFSGRMVHPGMSRHKTARKNHKKSVYRIQNDKRHIFPKLINRPESDRLLSRPVSRKEYQLTSELVEEPHLDTRHGFTGDAIVVIKFPDFGIAAVDINQIEIKACPFGHVISVTERDLPCMATLNRR